jgi:serine/threonine protein phosphatase PrpC
MRVINAEPEIRKFKITPDHDFVLLACDGIFDKAESKEVI